MGLNHAIILEMPTEASLPADSTVVIAALSLPFFFRNISAASVFAQ